MLIAILYLIVIPLTLGPLAKLNLAYNFTVEPLILVGWALLWFKDERSSLIWCLISGLTVDIVDFRPIGVWFGSLLAANTILIVLKRRFIEVSSFVLGLLALSGATLMVVALVGLFSGSLNLVGIALTAGLNSFIGAVIYYLFAVRMRLIYEWTGRVIHQ